MKKYFKTLIAPICIIVANYFLFSLWNGPTFIRTGIRLSVAFWSGRLIIKNHVTNMLGAALAGPLLLFVDHVILAGGYFLLFHLIDPARFEGQGLMALMGVAVSYSMFFWIPLGASYLGGLTARHM